MKESVMASEANHAYQNTTDVQSPVVVVQEAARPLSDWEVARGVMAMGVAGAVGGVLGAVIGGWGDKKGSATQQATHMSARIGGLLLGGISLVLAASANFLPSRRDQKPEARNQKSENGYRVGQPATIPLASIADFSHPQAKVAANSVMRDGNIHAISQQHGVAV